MNTFQDRFEQARKEKGLSLTDIAKKLDVSPQAVQQWTGKVTPKPERIGQLAAILGVTDSYLLFGTGEPHSYRSETDGGLVIPLLDVYLSAGGGAYETSGAIVKMVEVDPRWAREVLRLGHANTLGICPVTGDSMNPTLNQGDLVIVDSAIKSIVTEGVYAVQVDGMNLIKRFQKMPGNRFLMLSDNPIYKPIEITAETNGFNVMGRVVYCWTGRKFI